VRTSRTSARASVSSTAHTDSPYTPARQTPPVHLDAPSPSPSDWPQSPAAAARRRLLGCSRVMAARIRQSCAPAARPAVTARLHVADPRPSPAAFAVSDQVQLAPVCRQQQPTTTSCDSPGRHLRFPLPALHPTALTHPHLFCDPILWQRHHPARACLVKHQSAIPAVVLPVCKGERCPAPHAHVRIHPCRRRRRREQVRARLRRLRRKLLPTRLQLIVHLHQIRQLWLWLECYCPGLEQPQEHLLDVGWSRLLSARKVMYDSRDS